MSHVSESNKMRTSINTCELFFCFLNITKIVAGNKIKINSAYILIFPCLLIKLK